MQILKSFIMQKFLLVLLLAVVPILLFSQSTEEITLRTTRKLPKVELFSEKGNFPESYLYRLQSDSLVLLTDISSWTQPPFYAVSTINPNHYDYFTIQYPKETLTKSLIWGSILGVTSFYVVRGFTRTLDSERSIIQVLSRQGGHDGIVPGIMAGVTGFGIGVIIGQHLSKRKVMINQKRNDELRRMTILN